MKHLIIVIITAFIHICAFAQIPSHKIEGRIFLIETKTLNPKDMMIGMELTNLSDEDIYIPFSALRDTSGAEFTIFRNDSTLISVPYYLTYKSFQDKTNRGNFIISDDLVEQANRSLNNNVYKRADSIINAYKKNNTLIDPALCFFLKAKEHYPLVFIRHIQNRSELFSKQGSYLITNTPSLKDGAKKYPEYILNFKKYIPSVLKITPLKIVIVDN